jgi:hypothetical protein
MSTISVVVVVSSFPFVDRMSQYQDIYINTYVKEW